jgi:hypothetical protein
MFTEVKNGAVVTFPYDYDTLVQKNPHTKFAQTDILSMYAGTEANLNGHELVRVAELDAPAFDKQTQKLVQDSAPTLANSVWSLGWAVQALSQAEQDAQNTAQAKSVRNSRTEKLKDSDWTQIADSTADKTAWAAHRTALRDITAQAGFPWTIDWPVKPS